MSAEKSRRTMYGRKSEELRNYWIEKLSRELEPSTLILDYQRSKKYSSEPESAEIVLPEEVLGGLIARTNGSSFLISTALLAALNLCLHKYTGSRSIVIGSPPRKRSDGRASKANVMAIVNDIRTDMSLRQLLLNVRETLLEAYSKQDYQFERIVEHLGVNGIENRNPLFDIV